MKAKVEWVVGVLRVGPNFKEIGDEYEASCTVIRSGESAKIIGLSGKMSQRSAKAIREAMDDEGISEVTYSRKVGSIFVNRKIK